jgi:hypothetical protein
MSICPSGFFCFDNNTFLLLIVSVIILVVYLINKNSNKFAELKYSLLNTESQLNKKLDDVRQINNLMGSNVDIDLERIYNPLEEPVRKNPYLRGPIISGVPVNIPTRGYGSGISQVGILIQDLPHDRDRDREERPRYNNYNMQTEEVKNIQPQIQSQKQPQKQPEKPAIQLSQTKQANFNIEPQVKEEEKPKIDEIKPEEKVEEKEGFINFMRDNNKKILPLYGEETYRGSNQWRYYTTSDNLNSVKLAVLNRNKNCQDEYGCNEIYDGDEVSVVGYNSKFRVSLYKMEGPRYLPFL